MKKTLLFFSLLSFFISGTGQMTTDSIESIPLDTRPEADSLRKSIKSFIWQNAKKDSAVIISIEQDKVPDDYVGQLQNMKNADKVSIKLKNNFISNVFILHPNISNRLNIQVIYHGGHDGFLWEDTYLNNSGRPYSISVLDFFLNKGFDVVCVDMPLCGENRGTQIVTEENNTYTINNHDDLFNLKQPFYYFFEPVRKTIDFLQQQYDSKKFVMIGLSGGGWTTTIYSAIDTRILQSYAVAGSIPVPLRVNYNDFGDKEQNFSDFYNQFNYSTFYTLAAVGRNKLHYQILNKGDNCCFDYNGTYTWVPYVQEKVRELSRTGRYEFFYDTVATMHKISSVAVDTIYYHIKNELLIKNIPFSYKINEPNHALSVCNDDTFNLRITIHEGDNIQWYKNGIPIENATSASLLINSAGLFYAQISNISGVTMFSDSLTVADANIPRPSIISGGAILLSSSQIGNQWFVDGVPIPGATETSFKPLKPGSYSVLVKRENCVSEFSLSYIFGILIYPNPATHNINIKLNSSFGTISFELYDLSGKLILKDLIKNDKTTIPINNFRKGFYLLKISDFKGLIHSEKIVIQ